MTMPGGHSESQRVIPLEVQQLAARIRPQLRGRLGSDEGYDGDGSGNDADLFSSYRVLEFRRQVVAGMVYHPKIATRRTREGAADEDDDEGCCLHVKVLVPLPHTGEAPRIVAHQRAALQDPLEVL